jgi:hypothetical protein
MERQQGDDVLRFDFFLITKAAGQNVKRWLHIDPECRDLTFPEVLRNFSLSIQEFFK